MIKNLFVESYLHDLRIANIVDKSTKLGCDNCQDIAVWVDLIKNIPFTFQNGETWVISKVQFYDVTIRGKYTSDYIETHIKVFFKSSEKKRCTYFSATESKNGKKVLDLFQGHFDREWNRLEEKTPILDAIDKYLEDEFYGE